jgi:glycosyltransferase involved in cell wall biosynthesis
MDHHDDGIELAPTCAETPPPGLPPDARVLAVIPHLACHDWLAGALESLLAQTRPLDGIVVIDDASDDPPIDIVSAFPRVTLLHADENVGPYRLVQQVINETDHDAYLFQDADDWSAPDRLERLLLASRRTGAELVGSDYVLLDTRRWAARRVLFPVDANRALTEVPTGHAQQHPAGLVARTLVERVGGYATGMRFSGDDEFLRRAAHVAKVVNVPRPLYYRRHRSQSLTTSSLTGHGSPARQAILNEMSDRALANVAAVATGRTPDLTPLRTRGPVELRHLTGPKLEQLNGDRIDLRAVEHGHEPDRPRGAGRLEVPAPNAAQIVVVGAPGAGNDAVACGLAQHPAISLAGDVSWVAELGASITAADGMADAADVSVAGSRPGTQLDALAVLADDVTRLMSPALDAVIIGGSPPGPAAPDDDAATLREIARLPLTPARRWVGTLPAVRSALVGALRMFPELHVIHVVRDVDEIADLKGAEHTPEAATAAADWQAGTEVLLDLEQAVGPRLQRIRLRDVLADPDATLARCLDVLGEDHHPAVSHPFTPAAPPGADPAPHPSVPASARRLSAALVGPVRASVALERLSAPEPPGLVESDTHTTAAGTATTDGAAPRPANPGRRARQPRPAGRAAPMRRRPRVHPSVPTAIELVDRHVPADATVAVVSRGDDALLRFRASGRHLPSTGDGRYAGHHPADDSAAIRHLDEARAAGARFLLVPATSDWWFDHYRGFTDHLERIARRVADEDGHVLFDLTADTATGRRRQGSGTKPRVHVVSWSVSHNPYGRAHLLADVLAETCDVEVVGATFEPFGGGIWPPLVGSRVPRRTFPGGPLPELFPRMVEMAATLDGDAIYVSKPRLPGFGLAILAKLAHDRPLILDVDDHELAFVNATTGMTLDELRRLSGSDALLNPFGGPWTRYCDHLIGEADAVTVSNAVLQERYGGDIIGHVRDERIFDPSRWDRDDVRKTFGFAPDDRVVLFGGTPRRHKGIVETAAALRRAGDPRLKLCLIDTPELAEVAADLGMYADLIRTVPYQPMEDLPALVMAADLVCVLQDPDSPVVRFQIPAKITDALALGVPCLTTVVPPLADLAATGALNIVDGPLHEAISAVFDEPAAALRRAQVGREVFLEQLSYAAVRPRLTSIIEEQIANPRPPPLELGRAVDFAREVASGAAREARDPAPPPEAGGATTVPATYDIVMFWKQNDTGVYGRRHDMLLDQLARSPRVDRIVQFDHPIGISDLERLAAEPPTSHGRLLHEQTSARRAGLDDDADGTVVRRTFVYENRPGDDPERLADEHPPRAAHVSFVRKVLADAGVGAGSRPVILWGYPKHLDLPELIDALSPDLVVMDVVDDHRTWRSDQVEQDEIADHYVDVLARADLTFTNCAPMEAEVQPWARRVHLVPNGCQWPPSPVTGPPPDELAGIEGPIIGYVGNLSSRIDVDLLEQVVRRRPAWNLVLVGSTHAGRAALDLDIHPNVHFVGPQRADDARLFIERFDVAIIPHVDDHMTRKMHPLKAFVYCTAGVPVVSTAIDNLDELRGLVRVAGDADEFIAEIEAALADGRRPLSDDAREVLAEHAWTVRMAEIERLIDSAWENR